MQTAHIYIYIHTWFTYWKWWCPIAMLIYQRGYQPTWSLQGDLETLWIFEQWKIPCKWICFNGRCWALWWFNHETLCLYEDSASKNNRIFAFDRENLGFIDDLYNTHIYIYIYMYMYVCICVCVCWFLFAILPTWFMRLGHDTTLISWVYMVLVKL